MVYDRDYAERLAWEEEDELDGAGIPAGQELYLAPPAPLPALPPIPTPLQPPKKKDPLKSLLETPKSTDNDMDISGLLSVSVEDVMGGNPDLTDLTEVGDDVIGTGPTRSSTQTRRPPPRFRRTAKSYAPPTIVQGMG